jgi:hypothetical protein
MMRTRSFKRCLMAGAMGLFAALLAVVLAWLMNS